MVKINMPEEGSTLSFENYVRSMKVPFMVYADFESFIQLMDSCDGNPNSSFTKQCQMDKPSSFCYCIKFFDNKIYSQDPVMYTVQHEDEDIAQIFINTLEEDIKNIREI